MLLHLRMERAFPPILNLSVSAFTNLFISVTNRRLISAPFAGDFLLGSAVHGGEIYQISLPFGDVRAVPLGQHVSPTCIALDPALQTIYWADADDYAIRKAGYDGRGETTIVTLDSGVWG